MAVTIHGRALHYVFKISKRKETIEFLKNLMGMKVLRHEEFSEGCEATCNGPYANRWSKTMIGYGLEDCNFVLELTYNYTVKNYENGNDFVGICIKSDNILEKAAQLNYKIYGENIVKMPDGYSFFIEKNTKSKLDNKISKVILNCSSLQKTIEYWHNILGLPIFEQTNKTVTVGFHENETLLEFREIGNTINRAEAYGRVAFSCPYKEQEIIEKVIKEAKCTILTPLLSLDTPGKATVRVIILADPDQHEICFVDDESFRLLSKIDTESDQLLVKMITRHSD